MKHQSVRGGGCGGGGGVVSEKGVHKFPRETPSVDPLPHAPTTVPALQDWTLDRRAKTISRIRILP
jgi:hypothetical protein